MADKKTELTNQILELKSAVERSGKLRAQADASLSMARRDLAKVDEQLKALGVEPDNAEQQLALMEKQLEKKVASLQETVNAEIAEYNKVVEASKAVTA